MIYKILEILTIWYEIQSIPSIHIEYYTLIIYSSVFSKPINSLTQKKFTVVSKSMTDLIKWHLLSFTIKINYIYKTNTSENNLSICILAQSGYEFY